MAIFRSNKNTKPPGLAMETIAGIAHEPHARVPGFCAEAELRSAFWLVGTKENRGSMGIKNADFMGFHGGIINNTTLKKKTKEMVVSQQRFGFGQCLTSNLWCIMKGMDPLGYHEKWVLHINIH